VSRRSLVIGTLAGLLAGGFAALPAVPAQARTAAAVTRGGGPPAMRAILRANLAAFAAARDRGGVLTGLVDGIDHRPVSGACVTAIGAVGSKMTVTRADGRYVLSGLRPGSYSVTYRACSPRRSYAELVAGVGVPGQPDVQMQVQPTVVSGQLKNMPTVTLGLAGAPSGPRGRAKPTASGTGRIGGLVTGNGHPVGRVCVQAFPVGSGFVPTTVTSANGHYTLRKVRAGRYQVLFAGSFGCPDPGNWLSQWYKGVTTPFPSPKAAVIRVRAGGTTTRIDASLRRGGQISGTVRSKSGKPLLGICVTVNGRVAGGFTEAIPRTGKYGKYVVHGLFKGSYTVGFRIGCGSTGNYAPQWWRHAATRRAATSIRVAGTRKVSNVNGALEPGSAIAGAVRGGSASGPVLRGICVDAYDPRTGISVDSRTGKAGRYTLIGLAAGDYVVQYQTGCGNRGGYVERVRSVTVGAGQAKRGVNVFLVPDAGISGTVTNMHGKPVGGICVDIGGTSGLSFGIHTKRDGTYAATRLNPGTYTVQFAGGCGNTGSYLPQYYNGEITAAAADPVKLTAGHIRTGIDATMRPGATITGAVTDARGHRLNGICVRITGRSDQLFGDLGNTHIEHTANGSYRASNLSPGVYFVEFGCGTGSVARQWFRSRRTAESADLVSAAAGQVTAGVSAVMHSPGSITGSVTSRTGTPLSRICLLAVPAGEPFPAVIGPGPITRNGAYHIRHLPAGRYDVQFSTCVRNRYGSQWYRAKPTQGSATPVLVREGRATPHIDARLGAGGSISGHVIGSAGRGRQGFCVQAYDAATQSLRFAFTGRAGGYTLPGLSTGKYQIFAADCTKANAASITRPGEVQVRAPQAVTGINVRIPASGSISGRVLAGSPAGGRGNVCVIAVPVKPGGSFGLTTTNPDGTYKITELATGKYQVYFADPYCFFPDDDLAPLWFNDQPTQATADQVAVVAGADTASINATLAATGSISGAVTDLAHQQVSGECVTATPVGTVPDPLLGLSQRPEIAVTGAGGRYTLAGVQPGRYKVEFSAGCGDSGFNTQWWQHAGSAAAATVITVGPGARVTGIDAALRR